MIRATVELSNDQLESAPYEPMSITGCPACDASHVVLRVDKDNMFCWECNTEFRIESVEVSFANE